MGIYKPLLNYWPLVPALDLQNVYEVLNCNTSSTQENLHNPFSTYKLKESLLTSTNSETRASCPEFNCLIIGDGLGCLIKTLARKWRHATTNLNIYIAGMRSESLTRELILLSLFTKSSSDISLLERVEMFLEIMGNTFIRANTSSFVEATSAELIQDIVLSKQPMSTAPIVSMEYLKQRETDAIVDVLTFLKYRENTFDIAKAWENILRAYHGSRYDSRKNMYDYDFCIRLSHYPIINLRKYMDWRETGIAFKLRNTKYNFPNKTLRISRPEWTSKPKVVKNFSEYYVGDILTSPYVVFGVKSGNDSLFEKVNNEYRYTSQDISKFNVIDLMKEYTSFAIPEAAKTVKVWLMRYENVPKMQKFVRHFDAIYLTCDTTCNTEDIFLKLLKEKGVVVAETVKNAIGASKEEKQRHFKQIDKLAKTNHLKEDPRSKIFGDDYKIFILNEDTPPEN